MPLSGIYFEILILFYIAICQIFGCWIQSKEIQTDLQIILFFNENPIDALTEQVMNFKTCTSSLANISKPLIIWKSIVNLICTLKAIFKVPLEFFQDFNWKKYQSWFIIGILRRPLEFDEISKLFLKLLSSVKRSMEILSYFCGILRICELYK